jgi:hypothetical protein
MALLVYSNSDRVLNAVLVVVAPDKGRKRFGHKPAIGGYVARSGKLVPIYIEIANLSGIQISVSTPTSVYSGPLATVCSV